MFKEWIMQTKQTRSKISAPWLEYRVHKERNTQNKRLQTFSCSLRLLYFLSLCVGVKIIYKYSMQTQPALQKHTKVLVTSTVFKYTIIIEFRYIVLTVMYMNIECVQSMKLSTERVHNARHKNVTSTLNTTFFKTNGLLKIVYGHLGSTTELHKFIICIVCNC